MSLIFEALKKERAAEPPSALGASATIVSVLRSQERVAPADVTPSKAAKTPWSGMVAGGLVGILLAGGAGWLYQTSNSANLKSSSSVPQAQTQVAVLPQAAITPSPVALPVAAAPVISMPSPVVVTATPAPVLATATPAPVALAEAKPVPVSPARVIAVAEPKTVAALPVSQAVKAVAPEPAAAATPVKLQPILTQVQLSTEGNQFDARVSFQNFLQLLKMGQLPEAGVAADKISAAMGRNHVISLRAQGYLALKKNDLVRAKSQYLQLHDLLPEDREAGLNLALIDWRQGEKDAATKRVADMVEKFPNDPEVLALQLNVRNP